MIDYARSLVAAERPIDYYSVFISYSSKDEALAKRLHADLQAAGGRCWFAPHNLEIGEPILSGIDSGDQALQQAALDPISGLSSKRLDRARGPDGAGAGTHRAPPRAVSDPH